MHPKFGGNFELRIEDHIRYLLEKFSKKQSDQDCKEMKNVFSFN